ncbi:MAG: acyltransferase [Proteobacteria bacterium]|nr:acyltransferase [Pseudomonadota bacterium]
MTGATPSPARNPAFDVAKGMAMIAVVVSHVMRGAQGDGVIGDGSAFRLIDTLLYLVHVQLFLVISGYLAFPRANQPIAQRNRQISLGYSYFLWSVLSLSAMIAVGQPLPESSIGASFAALFYAPIQHYWFLPVIMIGYGLLYVLRTPLTLGLTIAVCLVFREVMGFSYYAVDYYVTFYLVGALLRAQPITMARPSTLTAICTAIFLGGAFVCQAAGLVPPTVPMTIPVSLAACYAVYRGAVALVRLPRVANLLALAGRQSLPIYLAHVFFAAGSRDAIVAAIGTDYPVLILTVSFVAGLAGPLVLVAIARRLKIERLVGFEPWFR